MRAASRDTDAAKVYFQELEHVWKR